MNGKQTGAGAHIRVHAQVGGYLLLSGERCLQQWIQNEVLDAVENAIYSEVLVDAVSVVARLRRILDDVYRPIMDMERAWTLV